MDPRPFPAPPRRPPEIKLGHEVLPADYASTTTVDVTLFGADPHEVELSCPDADLSALEPVAVDRFRAELLAGNVPGETRVSVLVGGEPVSHAALTLTAGEPLSAQLHTHGPMSEGDSTYAFQTDQAALWGVDLLWWTDHDYFYLPDLHGILYEPEWRGGGDLLTAEPPDGVSSWWEIGAGPELTHDVFRDDELLSEDDEPTMALSMSQRFGDDEEWLIARWIAEPSRLHFPLMSLPLLRFAVWLPEDFDPEGDALRVQLSLSSLAPGVQRTIWVVDPRDPLEFDVPDALRLDQEWVPGAWNRVGLDLADLAEDQLSEGLDSTVSGLAFHLGIQGRRALQVNVGALGFEDQLQAEALMDAQRDLLDAELSDQVSHLVGMEVSYGGALYNHLTVFGSWLPLTDYSLYPEPMQSNAARISRAYRELGGVVAATHPFGVENHISYEESEADDVAERTCSAMDSMRIYNAQLLEVGYTARGLGLEHHLALWDCLGALGYTVTGIGTGDHHFALPWLDRSNRYVTWVMAHDTQEESLLTALHAGRAFFGDPVEALGRDLSMDLRAQTLSGERAAMGHVLQGLEAHDTVTIEALVEGLIEGDELRWVVDGEVVRVDAGPLNTSLIDLTPAEWTFARVEVWTPTGAPLMFSNPIYLSTERRSIDDLRVPRPNPTPKPGG